MGTYQPNPNLEKQWYLVNAEGKTLGRLASEIALRLRGKHKPVYTPYLDMGDFIVVVNAEKVQVTGKKAADKLYHHYTGYPGGLKTTSFEKLIEKHPRRALENAVKGMLPKGPLGRKMFKKLKIYEGQEHPHKAQNPQAIDL